MNFPYRNNIYTDEQKIEIFKNLINYKLSSIVNNQIIPKVNIKNLLLDFLYQGNVIFLQYNNDDYFNTMILSDLFNDICRVECKFGNNISPLEYFSTNKNTIINNLKKENKLNPHNLREYIYENTVECSNHNPGLIKWFIKLYNAKRVLDMSSGWGDRLLGAMSAGVELYYGCDPNSCLHPNYKNMVELLLPFSPNPKGKFIYNEDKFEEHKITENNFDLLYTSPPYFDYEKYTDQQSQSHKKFKEEDDWLNNFLIPSIHKGINVIKNGGHIVLYITQEKGKTYMEKFLKYMKSIKDIYYLGCIWYSNKKYKGPHPIFIYKKYNKCPTILYNPTIKINKYIFEGKKYNIINDDYIIGGTKTRYLFPYLKKITEEKKIKNLVFRCNINDDEIISIPYCLYLLKKYDINLIFILYTLDVNDKLYKIATYYYPNITFINKDNKINYPTTDTLVLDPLYYEKYALKSLNISNLNHIKRLWIIYSLELKFLQQLLPNTHFLCVHLSPSIDSSFIYDKNRITLYKSSYDPFNIYPTKLPIICNPPNIPVNINFIRNTYLNTSLTKDSKMFEFIQQFGKEDDYIWNSTGIHQFL